MAEGGIQLQIIAPPSGAYVAVQFQYPNGTWANIDAWTGPLDPMANGYVKYWVDPKDFGKGPFRWVVWDKQGGKVLAMSAPFYFATFATVVGSIMDFSNPTPALTGCRRVKRWAWPRILRKAAFNSRSLIPGGHSLRRSSMAIHQWNWYNVSGLGRAAGSTADGYVRYWVDPLDFGLGPFRWVVWDKQGGNVLAMSAPFYFPTYATTVGTVIDLAAH